MSMLPSAPLHRCSRTYLGILWKRRPLASNKQTSQGWLQTFEKVFFYILNHGTSPETRQNKYLEGDSGTHLKKKGNHSFHKEEQKNANFSFLTFSFHQQALLILPWHLYVLHLLTPLPLFQVFNLITTLSENLAVAHCCFWNNIWTEPCRACENLHDWRAIEMNSKARLYRFES